MMFGKNMYAFLMHLMSKLFGNTAKKNMGKNNSDNASSGNNWMGPDGTESVSASATESETVALTAANTTKTVSFSSSTFSAGDTVAVSIDPYASDSGKVRMNCVWEYDTNT